MQALPKIVERAEAGSLQEPTDQNTKPDLDLVEPGAVPRGVDEPDTMGWIGQELFATRHRLEDSVLALLAEVVRDSASSGYQFDQRCGLVCIELIDDKDPLGVRIALNRTVDVRGEVCLGTRGRDHTLEDLAGCHIEVREQTQRPVSDVLELLPFFLSGP